jgi:hypothetical protein
MSGMTFDCNTSNNLQYITVSFYVDGNLVDDFNDNLQPTLCGTIPAMAEYTISAGSHSVTFGLSGSNAVAIYNWDDRIDILTP